VQLHVQQWHTLTTIFYLFSFQTTMIQQALILITESASVCFLMQFLRMMTIGNAKSFDN